MMTDFAPIAPVLVTGATGNVGRAVVGHLRRVGIAHVAGVRDPEAARALLGGDVETVRLDLAEPRTYRLAVQGMKGLFLLRPPPMSNVRQTLNLLVDAALAAGAAHVTFLSVQGADRRPWVPHRAVEVHLGAMLPSATLLRPGFFAQNLTDAYRRDIVEDDRLYVPAGKGRVAFVDVRDVAEIAARSFVEPSLRGQAFTLTGPEALGFIEVASLLSQHLGRQIRYEPASIPGYLRHLRGRRMPWPQVVVQTVLHVGLRFGDAEGVDPTLGDLLGRPPRSVGQFVEDHRLLWRTP